MSGRFGKPNLYCDTLSSNSEVAAGGRGDSSKLFKSNYSLAENIFIVNIFNPVNIYSRADNWVLSGSEER